MKGDHDSLAVGGPRPQGRISPGFWTVDRQIEALLWWHDRHGKFPGYLDWKPGGHEDYVTCLLPSSSLVQVDHGKWTIALADAQAALDRRRKQAAPPRRAPAPPPAEQLTIAGH